MKILETDIFIIKNHNKGGPGQIYNCSRVSVAQFQWCLKMLSGYARSTFSLKNVIGLLKLTFIRLGVNFGWIY